MYLHTCAPRNIQDIEQRFAATLPPVAALNLGELEIFQTPCFMYQQDDSWFLTSIKASQVLSPPPIPRFKLKI